jgi:LysR family transcriptional regulator, cys regulon transcriptional activator
VIKTYVRMGIGVGIVASMAVECDDDLVAIDAEGLFPRSTTWIGFRRDTVLKRYMSHFMQLCAPHLTDALVQRCLAARDQAEVDTIFGDIDLPLRGNSVDPGCGPRLTQPALPKSISCRPHSRFRPKNLVSAA